MKLTELEFYLEDFLVYSQTKNLSKKTVLSYEQSIKLFILYLKDVHEIEDPNDVRAGHIRQYIKYLQERGKYTVVGSEKSRKLNCPQNRADFKKTVSSVTINNYIRNIKTFFNWLHNVNEGFVMDGLHGKKEYPAVAISMKAQSKVLESFKLLGLDAATRFKVEQAKPEDLSDDLLLKILRGEF